MSYVIINTSVVDDQSIDKVTIAGVGESRV